jgi:hypothetical protein
MTAAIRPTQFSALKVLDPPDDQEEHGEDDERQRHVQQIPHERFTLLGGGDFLPPR